MSKVHTGLIVSAPTNPLGVVRELVDAVYKQSAETILREHGGDFHRYDGTCWPEYDVRHVRSDAYHWLEGKDYWKAAGGNKPPTLEPWDPTRYKIDNVVDALRAVTLLPDADPPMWIEHKGVVPAAAVVSMRNGLLHLPTRTLYPHTPRYFCLHCLPFAFDPDAPEPEHWLAFLHELWPDDASSIGTLQEAFGYILAGGTKQQKIFLLVGPRRAGKGTIGRVLIGLLGQHNVANPTMAGLGTDFGLQSLVGKPLALISDARMSGRKDGQIVVERLLSISGEDSIGVARKYKTDWTGRLPTRFMILTNEIPELTDSSGALASRFVLLVMTKSFLGSEDPELTERLLVEAPGIFNWALDGLDRLNERGRFKEPRSSQEAIQQLADLSSPVSAFVRQCCVLGSDQSVEVDGLWAAWKEWCSDEGLGPGTKAALGKALKAAFPMVQRSRPRGLEGTRVPSYTGLGLSNKYTQGSLGTRGTNRAPTGSVPSVPRDRGATYRTEIDTYTDPGDQT